MTKWEYHIEFITGLSYLSGGTGSEPFTVKQVLNKRGAGGWELISHNEEGWGIFKRPIEKSIRELMALAHLQAKGTGSCDCLAEADAEEAVR